MNRFYSKERLCGTEKSVQLFTWAAAAAAVYDSPSVPKAGSIIRRIYYVYSHMRENPLGQSNTLLKDQLWLVFVFFVGRSKILYFTYGSLCDAFEAPRAFLGVLKL